MISRPNGFLVVLNMIKELQIGQGKKLKQVIVMFGSKASFRMFSLFILFLSLAVCRFVITF